jgi:hypothetical protein
MVSKAAGLLAKQCYSKVKGSRPAKVGGNEIRERRRQDCDWQIDLEHLDERGIAFEQLELVWITVKCKKAIADQVYRRFVAAAEQQNHIGC